MTEATPAKPVAGAGPTRSLRSVLSLLEVDTRLLGMVGQWENGVMRWGRDRAMTLGAGAGFRRSARLIGRFDADRPDRG